VRVCYAYSDLECDMPIYDEHQVPPEPVPGDEPIPDEEPDPDDQPVPDHNPVKDACQSG